MSPVLRKLHLTAHVATSVAWFGAVAAFLALAVRGGMAPDVQVMRAAYVSMDVITVFVILPLCFASLASGIIASVATPWGLFRHYWVLIKLVLTCGSAAVLLLHTKVIGFAAQRALQPGFGAAQLGRVRMQLIADSALALLVLLLITALAVYKPRGVTSFGQKPRKA